MKTKRRRKGDEKILIIYRALGFQSPCLLSSCSFWRALNQSAAWRDPAELGFPASRRAAGHYRSPAPDTPRSPAHPTVTPRSRGSLGTHSRPCPICRRQRLQLAPAIRLRQLSPPSFCHGDAPHIKHRLRQAADILPLTSDLRRQRKWDSREGRSRKFRVSGRGLPECRSFCFRLFVYGRWVRPVKISESGQRYFVGEANTARRKEGNTKF